MLNNIAAIQTSYPVYLALSLVCVIGAVLCAIFVTVVVLIQPGNSNGISALGGNADTFYNKDKGKTLESKLKKLTYLCIGIMAVLMVLFYLVETLVQVV